MTGTAPAVVLDANVLVSATLSRLGKPAPCMRLIEEDTGADVYLVAIQAASTELGGTMCAQVRDAVTRLSTEIAALMEGGEREVP